MFKKYRYHYAIFIPVWVNVRIGQHCDSGWNTTCFIKKMQRTFISMLSVKQATILKIRGTNSLGSIWAPLRYRRRNYWHKKIFTFFWRREQRCCYAYGELRFNFHPLVLQYTHNEKFEANPRATQSLLQHFHSQYGPHLNHLRRKKFPSSSHNNRMSLREYPDGLK